MNNDTTTPKPLQPEQPSPKGLDGAACSPLHVYDWLDLPPVNDAACSPLHVYDWLDLPPVNDAERDAKEWLNKFTMPAWDKMEQGIEGWLARYRVTVEWKGKRYTCSGASRMGDVWLKTEHSSNYYDHRVNVEELSNWKRILLANAKEQTPT